jgi:predicted nucleic acid-binding Zn ribbon protein
MPPEDTVFDGKPNGSGEEISAEPAAATQNPVALTQEELDAKLEAKLDPIQRSMEQMNNFFVKLQEQAQQGMSAPKDTSGDDVDWATKFYNEPQGTVREEIASATAPALQQAASTMGKMLLDNHKMAIDQEFGPGAWDEIFESKLAPVVAEAAKTNPTSLMSTTAVRNAVNTIKGDNFAALAERAIKAAEAAKGGPDEATIEAAANRVVEMTGGIRRVKTDGVEKLDDEESQEFLKTFFKSTGETPDPTRLAKLMGAGNYISDYEKATKEDK